MATIKFIVDGVVINTLVCKSVVSARYEPRPAGFEDWSLHACVLAALEYAYDHELANGRVDDIDTKLWSDGRFIIYGLDKRVEGQCDLVARWFRNEVQER